MSVKWWSALMQKTRSKRAPSHGQRLGAAVREPRARRGLARAREHFREASTPATRWPRSASRASQ